jgi:hypothetical protein
MISTLGVNFVRFRECLKIQLQSHRSWLDYEHQPVVCFEKWSMFVVRIPSCDMTPWTFVKSSCKYPRRLHLQGRGLGQVSNQQNVDSPSTLAYLSTLKMEALYSSVICEWLRDVTSQKTLQDRPNKLCRVLLLTQTVNIVITVLYRGKSSSKWIYCHVKWFNLTYSNGAQ